MADKKLKHVGRCGIFEDDNNRRPDYGARDRLAFTSGHSELVGSSVKDSPCNKRSAAAGPSRDSDSGNDTWRNREYQSKKRLTTKGREKSLDETAKRTDLSLAEQKTFLATVEDLAKEDLNAGFKLYMLWYKARPNIRKDYPVKVEEQKKLFEKAVCFCNHRNKGRPVAKRTASLTPWLVFFTKLP